MMMMMIPETKMTSGGGGGGGGSCGGGRGGNVGCQSFQFSFPTTNGNTHVLLNRLYCFSTADFLLKKDPF
jgi:hypothetical protein